MRTDLMTSLYVFMLAGFIGFEVIRRLRADAPDVWHAAGDILARTVPR